MPCTATVAAPAWPWIFRSPARATTRIRRAPLAWTVASRGERWLHSDQLAPAVPVEARSTTIESTAFTFTSLPVPETSKAVPWLERALESTQARAPGFGDLFPHAGVTRRTGDSRHSGVSGPVAECGP